MRGGVTNSMSFSFWSESRCSVKSTRRKAFQRASNAAIEEATPTFNNRVKRSSRIGGIVSIVSRQPCAYASQLPLYCKEAAGKNPTIRMQPRRFTQMTKAFPKKLENSKAAIALHFAH